MFRRLFLRRKQVNFGSQVHHRSKQVPWSKCFSPRNSQKLSVQHFWYRHLQSTTRYIMVINVMCIHSYQIDCGHYLSSEVESHVLSKPVTIGYPRLTSCSYILHGEQFWTYSSPIHTPPASTSNCGNLTCHRSNDGSADLSRSLPNLWVSPSINAI